MSEADVLAAIVEAFRGRSTGGSYQAAVALAQSEEPTTVAAIEDALVAADFETRQAGIYLFGLRGAAGAATLIEIAGSSSNAQDRDYALMVLAYNAPTDAAAEAVIAASVLDPDPHVRRRTREYLAFSLFAVAHRDPRPRLRQLCRRGSIRHRWRALRALRRVNQHARLLRSAELSGWRRAILWRYRRLGFFARRTFGLTDE